MHTPGRESVKGAVLESLSRPIKQNFASRNLRLAKFLGCNDAQSALLQIEFFAQHEPGQGVENGADDELVDEEAGKEQMRRLDGAV